MMGIVNEIVVVTLQRGRDHKLYPAQMPPPKAWRYEAIMIAHRLCHEQGLSMRAAQRELAALGYRRSLGTIWRDLDRPMCPRCRDAEPAAG